MSKLNRSRRKRPLEVEALESMVLLSTMTSLNTPPVAATTIPLPIIVGLKGATRGTYSSDQKVPDAGTTYSVLTAGRFEHYGPAAVFGSLQTLGNIASGQASGTLHVIVPGGTLTLKLTGPSQPGMSSLPTEFSFVITGGTGKFHNSVGDPVGKGAVGITLKPNAAGASPTHGHGQIVLVFKPGIVAIA
jgi:hypothetical protein